MKSEDKVNQLASIIRKEIVPLINNDYVLYGLPYYTNIGDTLIWEGELELLKEVPYRCVGTCAWDAYPQKKLDKNTVVIITGGGYFGDIWRDAWEHVLNGIKGLENNRIIIFPNSIYYSNDSIQKRDSTYLSRFHNLVICARDQFSYNYAKEYFTSKVILVPDMAFYISSDKVRDVSLKSTNKILYLKRADKELNVQLPTEKLSKMVETHDWPTMEKLKFGQKLFYKVLSGLKGIQNHGFLSTKTYSWLEACMFNYIHRPMMTKLGKSFMSGYKTVFTTRLHAMILGVLMGKEVVFLNNSYGKLKNFYDTWLKDCDNVREQ